MRSYFKMSSTAALFIGICGATTLLAQSQGNNAGRIQIEAGWRIFKTSQMSIALPPALHVVSQDDNSATFKSADGSVIANMDALEGPNAAINFTQQDAAGDSNNPSATPCATIPPSYKVETPNVSAFSCIGKNGKIVYEVQRWSTPETSVIFHIESLVSQR